MSSYLLVDHYLQTYRRFLGPRSLLTDHLPVGMQFQHSFQKQIDLGYLHHRIKAQIELLARRRDQKVLPFSWLSCSSISAPEKTVGWKQGLCQLPDPHKRIYKK